MRLRCLLVIPLVALSSQIAWAGDDADFWPAWRGPLASGESPTGKPPTEWSESKNVKWKIDIPGRGHGSPVVWGDRVYILTAVKTDKTARLDAPNGEDRRKFTIVDTGATPDPSFDALLQDPPPGGDRPPRGDRPRPGGQGGPPRNEPPNTVYDFVVIALDRATGKTIWQKTVHSQVPHSGTHPDGTQASASPIVDGKHIYAYFGSFGLYCLDLDGNVKWSVDLGDMQTRNSFGEGASPVVCGDMIVVNWDHEGDDFIVALDKTTGKEVWRKTRDEPTTWTTPLVAEVAGKRQIIVPGTNQCIAYDAKTGETIWHCGGLTANVIPSGIVADGVAYLMSGFRGQSLKAIKLSNATGDISGKKDAILFDSTELKTPYVPSPLLYRGSLYFFDNNRAVLTNLDAKTGKPIFEKERIEGMQQIYASPVAANGFIYLVGRDGETVVLKAGEKLDRVGASKLDDGFDASPAIAGDQLFLRGREHLYCLAAK